MTYHHAPEYFRQRRQGMLQGTQGTIGVDNNTISVVQLGDLFNVKVKYGPLNYEQRIIQNVEAGYTILQLKQRIIQEFMCRQQLPNSGRETAIALLVRKECGRLL